MLRRQLRKQIGILQTGDDPLNTAFEPGTETVSMEAGSFATKGENE